MLDRTHVKNVLTYPSKHLVELCLQLVNLKDKELEAITLVDMRGFTEESACEKMRCSSKTVHNYRLRAYKKMAKAWEGEKLILTMLKDF